MMMAAHPVLQALEQHILRSIPEYIALFALFLVAVIANMPHSDVITQWLGAFVATPAGAAFHSRFWQKYKDFLAISYKWLYDSLQAFMAARHPPAAPSSVPTLPSAPMPQPPQETK